jgi:hypothetical protein
MDKKCTNSSAMRLSHMFEPCNGQRMVCQVFLNLAEGVKENVIDGNILQNECTQIGGGGVYTSEEYDKIKELQDTYDQTHSIVKSDSGKGMLLIAAAALCIAIAVGIMLFRARPKKV